MCCLRSNLYPSGLPTTAIQDHPERLFLTAKKQRSRLAMGGTPSTSYRLTPPDINSQSAADRQGQGQSSHAAKTATSRECCKKGDYKEV